MEIEDRKLQVVDLIGLCRSRLRYQLNKRDEWAQKEKGQPKGRKK